MRQCAFKTKYMQFCIAYFTEIKHVIISLESFKSSFNICTVIFSINIGFLLHTNLNTTFKKAEFAYIFAIGSSIQQNFQNRNHLR